MLDMKKHQQKGFTLVELMVTIGIVAIMATIALPNMSSWVARNRVKNRAEQVATLFRFARSEAVRLNKPVRVGFVQIKSDGKPDKFCTPASRQNMQGMAAFTVGSTPGIYTSCGYTSGSDLLLRTVVIHQDKKSTDANVKIRLQSINLNASGVARDSGADTFTFYPDGRFERISGGSYTGTSGSLVSTPVTGSFNDAYVRLDFGFDTTKNRNIVKLLIEPSGRISTCPVKNPNKFCEYVFR